MRSLDFTRSATLVAAMLFVFACSDTDGPSPESSEPDIAFVQGGDIYTTSLDSGATPRLVAKGLVGPSWSPDGKRIAALRASDPQALFLMNADGTNLHQLTTMDWSEYNLSDPAWKPDGQVISFSVRCKCCICTVDSDVWQINVDGTGEAHVAVSFYTDLQWSPDVTKYTLQGIPDRIFIQNSDGTNRLELAQGCCVDWSPDGAHIAYSHIDRIHLIEPTGANDQLLETPAIMNYTSGPKWSRDGMRIAFETYGTNPFPSSVAYVMNADGTGLVTLSPGLDPNSSVDWSSDGQHLAFSAYASQADHDAGISRLYIVRPDGSDLHPITDPGSVYFSEWRPVNP